MLKRQREQAKRDKKVAKDEKRVQRQTGDETPEMEEEVVRETPIDEAHQW